MRFPSISIVASELRQINAHVEGEADIRLQVYPSGEWSLRVGDSSYDQDHHGYWGASSLPGYDPRKNRTRRFPSFLIARDLISQCKDHYSQATDQGAE
jgi:hypothetical protein